MDLRIFLNYRREDTSGHAGRLYDALAGRFGRDNVFMDVDTIGLGSDFATVIEGAVKQCDVLVALIGSRWLDAADADGRRRLDDPDDFVRLELESALTSDLSVVPVTVQGAVFPDPSVLPPEPRAAGATPGDRAARHRLARRHQPADPAARADRRGARRGGCTRLAGPPKPPPPLDRARAPRARDRRRLDRRRARPRGRRRLERRLVRRPHAACRHPGGREAVVPCGLVRREGRGGERRLRLPRT